MLKRKPKTENEKTEEYFHREVFPMINAFAKECKGHPNQNYIVKGLFVNANDNKLVKEYIAKGYGITNRIKSKHPLEMSVAKIIGGEKQ
jgi:hypothetical protein